MGRVETKYESTAVAKARNALNVYAVLAMLCGLLLWALWHMVVRQYGMSGHGADLVGRTILGVYGGVAAAHLVLAYFVGRASTVAWALALGLDVLFLVWTLLELLDSPTFLDLVPIAVNVWVVSRLLDSDVVRVFGRSGEAAPPGEPPDPYGGLPGLPPVKPPAPYGPPPPVAPYTPAYAPPPPPKPAPSWDYFG